MNLNTGGIMPASRVRLRRGVRWQPRRGVLRARFVVALVTIDMLCVITGLGGVDLLLGHRQDTQWIFNVLAMAPVYLAAAINYDAYGTASLSSRLRAARTGLRALGVAAGGIVLAAFCLKVSATFSRATLLFGVVAAGMLLVLARYMFIGRAERLLGGKPYNTLLLADDDAHIPAGDFSILIASSQFIDPDRHDPDMYDRLARLLQNVDRVVVSCAAERRDSWARALKGANVQSEILVPELSSLTPLGHGWHANVPTMVVANGPLRLSDRVVKRVFDAALALLALIILAPLLVTVAIMIKLDSPGPVFFVQTRIGRDNRKFQMRKFRSMRSDQCDAVGHASTARDDDRITRVGALIRRTSIDELPQLLNVLTGDMSIVGPRPHALGSRAADKLFWDIDERYWHRHATKPGLTGLAQVRGFRGATHEEDDLVNRLQADLEYLDHWSIMKDVWIILMTARVLLHRNAY